MELLAILLKAKDAGLDLGQYVALIMIYFMLRNFVVKQNEELKKIVCSQVDKLVVAIHDQKAEMKSHNERITKIEIHTGLKEK